MRKSCISLISIVALGASAAFAGAAGVTRPSQPARLAHSYTCTTTQANYSGLLPQVYREIDTMEYIGTNWQHGTARAADGSGEPFYDYYLGRVGKEWVYIQINPLIPSSPGYFVGMSDGAPRTGAINNSWWRIVFPSGEGSYRFTELVSDGLVQRFRIAYADLNQLCVLPAAGSQMAPAAMPNAAPAPKPTPVAEMVGSWICRTTKTGQDESDVQPEYLTVKQMSGNWWQGRAMDLPSGGRVIYEFNIFATHSQRVLVEVDAFTGSYDIATSPLSPNLDHSTWTVIFPAVKNGYTFEDIPPTPFVQRFRIAFADGSQTCTKE